MLSGEFAFHSFLPQDCTTKQLRGWLGSTKIATCEAKIIDRQERDLGDSIAAICPCLGPNAPMIGFLVVILGALYPPPISGHQLDYSPSHSAWKLQKTKSFRFLETSELAWGRVAHFLTPCTPHNLLTRDVVAHVVFIFVPARICFRIM